MSDAFRSISRSRALVRAVSVVAVGLILASGVAIWMLRRDAIADTMDDNHRVGVVLAEQTARSFQAVDLVLEGVAEQIAESGVEDIKGLHARFGGVDVHTALARRLIDLPQAEAFTIVDATGNLVNGSRDWPVPTYSLAYQEYFRHLAETPGISPYISEPGTSHSSGERTVFLTRRLSGPNGLFLGSVGAPMRLDYFQTFLAKTGLSDGTAVTLLRRDGTVLVRFPVEGILPGARISHTGPWDEMVARGGGQYTSSGAFATVGPAYVSVHPLQAYPIVVDVVRKATAALARWRQETMAIGLGALVVTISLAVLARALGRQIALIDEAQARVRASEASYRDLSDATRDGMIVVEPSTGRLISANSSALRMFGVAEEREFLACKPWDYSPEWQPDGRLSAEMAHEMVDTALREGTHFFEWVHARTDGTRFPADVLLTRVRRGNSVLIYSTIRDVTERKRADEQISRMAHFDGLTGLANRQMFVVALKRQIARAERDGESFAVLYLDLDHFKDVNDTLGHPVGDLLLQTIAGRLQASVRAVDIVARFGGDEFAVLVSDIRDTASAAAGSEEAVGPVDPRVTARAEVAAIAAEISERIVAAVAEPITVENNRIHSGASVGISIYDRDLADAETMLSHADVALYRAKTEQRGSWRFFSDGMDAEVRSRVNMNIELREALDLGQFALVFQPQVELRTGRIIGLEALVRWCHPTLGMMGAGRFIPEAERNGLIVPLGQWVLREACRQSRQWLDAGIALPLVAVNLSGVQFKAPLGLENDIAEALTEFDLAPRLLELELTESVLMEASRDHNALLSRLREKGHRIAIDDFGTGYSSLDYLRRYPADRIKIAQTFVAEIGVASGSDAIVRAALSLARELNIEVVVEGVETEAQLELLRAWGARIAQGYYFARPMAAEQMGLLLRIGKIRAAAAAVEIAA